METQKRPSCGVLVGILPDATGLIEYAKRLIHEGEIWRAPFPLSVAGFRCWFIYQNQAGTPEAAFAAAKSREISSLRQGIGFGSGGFADAANDAKYRLGRVKDSLRVAEHSRQMADLGRFEARKNEAATAARELMKLYPNSAEAAEAKRLLALP